MAPQWLSWAIFVKATSEESDAFKLMLSLDSTQVPEDFAAELFFWLSLGASRLLNTLITVLASCYAIGHLQRLNKAKKTTLQQSLQEPVYCPGRALT